MNRRSFFGRSIAAIAAVATAPIAARANQLAEGISASPNQQAETVVLADRFLTNGKAPVFGVKDGATYVNSAHIGSNLTVKVGINSEGEQYVVQHPGLGVGVYPKEVA